MAHVESSCQSEGDIGPAFAASAAPRPPGAFPCRQALDTLDYDQFPHQEGSSLNASGINYGMLRQQDALKRLKEMETMSRPGN